MKIKNIDALGIDLGHKWIRNDHPEFPKGNLYTEDEFQKKRIELRKKETETKIGLWFFNRGFIGIFCLAFEFFFGNEEKLSKKVYKEIFKEEEIK